jgi:hypothetical protein
MRCPLALGWTQTTMIPKTSSKEPCFRSGQRKPRRLAQGSKAGAALTARGPSQPCQGSRQRNVQPLFLLGKSLFERFLAVVESSSGRRQGALLVEPYGGRYRVVIEITYCGSHGVVIEVPHRGGYRTLVDVLHGRLGPSKFVKSLFGWLHSLRSAHGLPASK